VNFGFVFPLAFTFGGSASPEENLSLKTRRPTMMMRESSVVMVVLNALKSDGVVGDSRPFPVVLDHLWGVEVG
jgi:hypothetical protein